jgi:hypothetical protein
MTKRRILLALALVLAVTLAYGLRRGLRYPPLQFDPPAVETVLRSPEGWRLHALGAYRREAVPPVVFRAWAPSPRLLFEVQGAGSTELTLENVHPAAEVLGEGVEVLGRDGLQLRLRVSWEAGQNREVEVRFPERERYRFAAIGDAGGRGELSWCFERAAQLEADFLLHVGDIAYHEGDFDAAAVAFREAPMPVYTAIGNHDFHGGFRYRFRFFQEHFGPLNGAFELAGNYFLNVDTAADLVPADRGNRGALLAELRDSPPPGPLLVFTHRPFADPRVLSGKRDDPHALNRTREADWLRDEVLGLGAQAMLAGHIHNSFDFDDQGLRTIIVGDGLGVRGDKAKILVGEFAPGLPFEFRWEPLEMPESAWSPEYDGDRKRPANYEKLH